MDSSDQEFAERTSTIPEPFTRALPGVGGVGAGGTRYKASWHR